MKAFAAEPSVYVPEGSNGSSMPSISVPGGRECTQANSVTTQGNHRRMDSLHPPHSSRHVSFFWPDSPLNSGGIVSFCGRLVAYALTALLGLVAVSSLNIGRTTRRRDGTKVALAILLIVAASIYFLQPVRQSILWAAGRVLTAADPVEPVDAIVLPYHDYASLLEAADLAHSGVATRVAVFADPPDSIDREFIRRGLPYEDLGARDLRRLQALGVKNVEQIPKQAAESNNLGPTLADWCDQHRYHSILVISDSRLDRRVLHRVMKGHQTRIIMAGTRYSQFHPGRWWQTHGGIRTEIEESEKLLVDILRHPIS